MVKIFKNTIISVKQASKTMLGFEIVFKIVTMLCLIPSLVLLFDLVLGATGYSFITKFNIRNILRNPVLILFFVGVILVYAFITLIEISTLTVFFGYGFKDRKYRLRNLLFLSYKELKRLLHPKNLPIILYMVCIIPIINFRSFSNYLLGKQELINFTINYVIRSKTIIVIVIAVMSVIIFITSQTIFVFCYFFLEHRSLKDSFRQSQKLIKGRILKSIGSILACNLFFMLVYLMFYMLIILLVQTGTLFFYEQKAAYAIFLTFFNMVNKLLVVGISIFESVAVAGVIVQLYFRYTGHKKKLYSNINFRKKISAGLLKSVQKMAVIIIAAVTILTGAGIYFIVNADYSLLNSEKTLITSHRGSSVSAPENTIASIKAAVDAMADYAEIDARSTKDGVVIVFHDPSLKRITGINKKVWQVKYSQIIGMDAGSWFSKKFSGEKIPTLKQILEYSKGKIKLNIEIKTSPGDKDLEESIVKLIEEYDMTDSCVVSSFSYNSLKKIKKLNPDIRTGYIISGVYGNFYDLEYADFFSMRQSIVTERIVTELHKRKKELHVWTVNDKYSINRLARLGVDNIITDDPVKARSIIYSADLPEYTTDFLELVFHY